MPIWLPSLVAILVSLVSGVISSYVTCRVLLARHDERILNMKEEIEKLRKHYHDLREDLRKLLVDYFMNGKPRK